MSEMSKLLYTARMHTEGGRDGGAARSADGQLDIRLSMPGGPAAGTNPEQLLAAGWSACFESAIELLARKQKVTLPKTVSIDTEVDLSLVGGAYTLAARLTVSLPDIPRDVAQALVDEAHQICPYSRVTRGNIDVTISLA